MPVSNVSPIHRPAYRQEPVIPHDMYHDVSPLTPSLTTRLNLPQFRDVLGENLLCTIKLFSSQSSSKTTIQSRRSYNHLQTINQEYATP